MTKTNCALVDAERCDRLRLIVGDSVQAERQSCDLAQKTKERPKPRTIHICFETVVIEGLHVPFAIGHLVVTPEMNKPPIAYLFSEDCQGSTFLERRTAMLTTFLRAAFSFTALCSNFRFTLSSMPTF